MPNTCMYGTWIGILALMALKLRNMFTFSRVILLLYTQYACHVEEMVITMMIVYYQPMNRHREQCEDESVMRHSRIAGINVLSLCALYNCVC